MNKKIYTKESKLLGGTADLHNDPNLYPIANEDRPTKKAPLSESIWIPNTGLSAN